MKVGDSKDVNVTFPENYQAENLKGKPAVFKVTLQKIERKELPEINDAFASNVSEFETLDEYKKDIEKRLQIKKDKEAERKLENDLIEQIVKNSEVEVPNVLVERQLDNTADKKQTIKQKACSIIQSKPFLIFPLVERDVPTVGMKRSQVGDKTFPS